MKKFIVLLMCVVFSQYLFAQKTHTVKSGETLSAIAKDYGTTVGDIMRLNDMNVDSKLLIGAKIKIPASGKKVVKTGEKVVKTDNTHTIQSGETLSQLAEKYGTTVGDIMRFNGMNADSKLIVGEKIKIPQSGVTVTRKEPLTAAVSNDINKENETNNVSTNETANNSIFIPPATTSESDEGFYATSYRLTGDESRTSGTAKIFKTESGWNDQKYFILMNNIEPGRVVKVENPQSNKIIYAKVLWNLGSGKENEGLTYRISEAAAQKLGINGEEFNLAVTYFK